MTPDKLGKAIKRLIFWDSVFSFMTIDSYLPPANSLGSWNHAIYSILIYCFILGLFEALKRRIDWSRFALAAAAIARIIGGVYFTNAPSSFLQSFGSLLDGLLLGIVFFAIGDEFKAAAARPDRPVSVGQDRPPSHPISIVSRQSGMTYETTGF